MIERKIIISGIVSTEFLHRVKLMWDIKYFNSPESKKIGMWIWEFYTKHNTAPKKEIETIFYDRADKLSEVEAKDIANIIDSLSTEYVNDDNFNLEYMVEITETYFKDRHTTIHTEAIDALRRRGEIEKAYTMACEFKPLQTSKVSIESYIQTISEITKKEKPKLIIQMFPWLIEGQTSIIYGGWGTGKSLLTMTITYLLGLEDSGKNDIGEWYVKNPTGTLYIDGELGESDVETRIKSFYWLGKQKYKLRAFCVPEYQQATEDSFYLSERKNQLKIIGWLKNHRDYKVVVLDSASTLFGLENENDNSEWNNKVNPFLRDLRALDVACILLHHAGKDGKKGLRGASAMGAMAHNIFRLVNHNKKNINDGEAWFILETEKQRSGGRSFKKFSLHYTQSYDDQDTHWEVTENI